MIGCLGTRVRKQPIIAHYFESENELKLYNLGAWIRPDRSQSTDSTKRMRSYYHVILKRYVGNKNQIKFTTISRNTIATHKGQHAQNRDISSVRSQKLVSLIFTFFRRDKKTEYVLYCWKSDRIISSNIQIHCYWCFELSLKISQSLWRVSLELRHFDHFFVENHPITIFWASFSWQNIVSR